MVEEKFKVFVQRCQPILSWLMADSDGMPFDEDEARTFCEWENSTEDIYLSFFLSIYLSISFFLSISISIKLPRATSSDTLQPGQG